MTKILEFPKQRNPKYCYYLVESYCRDIELWMSRKEFTTEELDDLDFGNSPKCRDISGVWGGIDLDEAKITPYQYIKDIMDEIISKERNRFGYKILLVQKG